MFISNKTLAIIMVSLLGRDARASNTRGLENSCTECTNDSKKGTDYTFTNTGLVPAINLEVTVSITNFGNTGSTVTLVLTSDSTTSYTGTYTGFVDPWNGYSFDGLGAVDFKIVLTTDPAEHDEIISWGDQGVPIFHFVEIGCMCPTDAPTQVPSSSPSTIPSNEDGNDEDGDNDEDGNNNDEVDDANVSSDNDDKDDDDDFEEQDCCENKLFSKVQSLFV